MELYFCVCSCWWMKLKHRIWSVIKFFLGFASPDLMTCRFLHNTFYIICLYGYHDEYYSWSVLISLWKMKIFKINFDDHFIKLYDQLPHANRISSIVFFLYCRAFSSYLGNCFRILYFVMLCYIFLSFFVRLCAQFESLTVKASHKVECHDIMFSGVLVGFSCSIFQSYVRFYVWICSAYLVCMGNHDKKCM